MSRGPDAATLLERALLAAAQASGCPLTVTRSDWTRWSSATFTGARHLLTLAGEADPALDDWVAGLPEAEITLRGHLVADCVVMRVEKKEGRATIALEVLTLDER